ncbi:hypothetical protein A3761_16120 [Oleiphilus sp. HI0123]|nr:hypothetical protein A3761_16120 [Oleiphilus sp. HI0123]
MREPITGILKINQNSLNYAANKRAVILNEIKSGSFDYQAHFPNSQNALKYSGSVSNDIDLTISRGVEMWLELKSENRAKSTIEGYEAKAKHVKAYFGDKTIRSLRTTDITNFRKHLTQNLEMKVKTVNDVFTVLRGVTRLAYQDHITKTDIMERIPNLERDETEGPEADPYTIKELEKIIELERRDYSRPEIINMFIFTCWTGLSLSEVIALAWEDIDFNTYTVNIKRAYVSDEFKVPKEASRTRSFQLLRPAIDTLLKQHRYSYTNKPIEISVKNRSNTHSTSYKIRPIFKNFKSQTDEQLFSKRSVGTAYETLLREANVRHRGPNQCRHTFASMLITKYVPLGIVAEIMGHTSESMLKKHYGKIIHEDRPSTAKLISPFLGLE